MGKDPDMASAVAAIRTLLEFLKRDQGLPILVICQLLKYCIICYCTNATNQPCHQPKLWDIAGPYTFRRNTFRAQGESDIGYRLSDGGRLLRGCLFCGGTISTIHQPDIVGTPGKVHSKSESELINTIAALRIFFTYSGQVWHGSYIKIHQPISQRLLKIHFRTLPMVFFC